MKHQVKVLIVESREMFDIMAPVIQAELHPDSIFHCASKAEAMAEIGSHTKYDMIFADWELSGEAFMKAVRTSAENHFSPLVVLATHDENAFIGRVMRCGATDLLMKPFLEKGLVAKIRKVAQGIEHRRHHRVNLPETVAVQAEIRTEDEVRTTTMELINISVDGCKAKTESSCVSRIYDHAALEFTFRDSEFNITANLIRLEADPALAKTGGDHMFASFVFVDVDESLRDKLNQMLDELSEYEIK